MRLKGILSSKRRLEAHRRNMERAAPPPPDGQLDPDRHKPALQSNGAIACSCNAVQRYSPGAYARHLAGLHNLDAEHGTFTVGVNDLWLLAQQPECRRQAAEDADAERRAAQIEAYFEQQRRRAPRVADGVGKSDFFD